MGKALDGTLPEGPVLIAVKHEAFFEAIDLPYLFDLPVVLPGANARLGAAGLTQRVTLHPGSFRDDPLPEGADAISLIRVLYDHADATVAALLARVQERLPAGGRLVVAQLSPEVDYRTFGYGLALFYALMLASWWLEPEMAQDRMDLRMSTAFGQAPRPTLRHLPSQAIQAPLGRMPTGRSGSFRVAMWTCCAGSKKTCRRWRTHLRMPLPGS